MQGFSVHRTCSALILASRPIGQTMRMSVAIVHLVRLLWGPLPSVLTVALRADKFRIGRAASGAIDNNDWIQ